MNQFKKLMPNVWGLLTQETYNRGDIATITTKYGKEVEVEVFNLIKTDTDGNRIYSVIRADGTNSQTRAQAKADRRREWASGAEQKSNDFYEKSNQHRDFLSLGEPIKVGHHSEGRHRRIIEQANNNMGKSVEMSKKAERHEQVAEYWERRAKDINLSMPESLEYFEFKLEEATKKQQLLKDRPELREHSYSLTYATKAVKEITKKLALAQRLWGEQ